MSAARFSLIFFFLGVFGCAAREKGVVPDATVDRSSPTPDTSIEDSRADAKDAAVSDAISDAAPDLLLPDLSVDVGITPDITPIDFSTTWEGGTVQVQSITAGHAHACALLDTGEVVCWGANGGGQLGDGTQTDRESPVFVHGIDDAIQVSAGWLHSCAVRRGGGVACWGQNLFGSVGDGTSGVARLSATDVVDLTGAEEVRAAIFSSCARRADQKVFCWGYNVAGQLGDGSFSNSTRPVEVQGLDQVSRLASGGGHYSCAIRLGEVYCWGINDLGQLGGGTAGGSSADVVKVAGLSDAEEVATAFSHACARRQNGELVCWGDNASGQIGDGTIDPRLQATTVTGVAKARSLGTQLDHVCVLDDEAGTLCWGGNAQGQLGDGTRNQSSVPVPVADLPDVLQVAVGSYFGCALQSGHRIRCWGSGTSGQLGDGRMQSSLATVPVLLP